MLLDRNYHEAINSSFVLPGLRLNITEKILQFVGQKNSRRHSNASKPICARIANWNVLELKRIRREFGGFQRSSRARTSARLARLAFTLSTPLRCFQFSRHQNAHTVRHSCLNCGRWNVRDIARNANRWRRISSVRFHPFLSSSLISCGFPVTRARGGKLVRRWIVLASDHKGCARPTDKLRSTLDGVINRDMLVIDGEKAQPRRTSFRPF